MFNNGKEVIQCRVILVHVRTDRVSDLVYGVAFTPLSDARLSNH